MTTISPAQQLQRYEFVIREQMKEIDRLPAIHITAEAAINAKSGLSVDLPDFAMTIRSAAQRAA